MAVLWITSLFFGAFVSTLLAVLFCLFFALKLPEFSSQRARKFANQALRGPIVHRGGSPENTLAALRNSKAQGAVGVEVDLCFTRDGHPVLLHDVTVDRTSDGRGAIAHLTLAEARRLDFSKGAERGTGVERIPALSEVVDLCEELDLLIFLEVKYSINQAVKVLKKLFSDRPSLYSRIMVISFQPGFIFKLRRADPSIQCGLLLVGDILVLAPNGVYEGKERWKYVLSPLADWLINWSLRVWLVRLLGIKLLLPYKGLILDGRIDAERWRKRGVSLVAWTVNKTEEKEHFQNSLKIPFITDNAAPNSNAPDQLVYRRKNMLWPF